MPKQTTASGNIKTSNRQYFTKSHNVIDLPDLISHQNKSFQWFVEEGLGELLAEISPIEDYTGAKLSLKL